MLKDCWKCRSRRLKKRHPATYVLNWLRQTARKRRLAFTITLQEFKRWCEETGYLALRGRRDSDMSIDRIDHSKGYHINNIKMRAFLENCTDGYTVPGIETKPNERRQVGSIVHVDGDADESGLDYNVPVDGEPF